jgi:hypothetical protein
MRYYWGQYDPIEERENHYQLVFDAAMRTRRRWGREIDPHRILDQIERESGVSYARLYDLMMSDLVLSDETTHWAEKIQLVWTKIPDFVNAFEDGRAILIIRDPRSVLASFKNFTYEPEPAYLGAIFNMLDVLQRANQYSEQLDPSHFHVIRYEDIVTDPEATLTSAFNFLDLSSDHDLLSTEGWTDTSGDSWEVNSSFKDEEFDKEAAIYRWKNNLEPWELSLCEMVVSDVMTDFGYEPSDVSTPDEDALEILRDDSELSEYYRRWKKEGKGVESYPSNPENPSNWSENVKE